MGIVRDFRQSTVADLRALISTATEDQLWFPAEWFKDTFLINELDITNYLDDIDGFHKTMIDKNNTSLDQFAAILKKVQEVDCNYGNRLHSIDISLESLDLKINQLKAMITPAAITADPVVFNSISDYVVEQYGFEQQDLKNDLESYTGILDQNLEEPPSIWDSLFSAAVGFTDAVVSNCVVEPVLFFTDLFGFKDVRRSYEDLQDSIAESVPDKTWFYGGKVVGDAASMVVGIAEIAIGGPMMIKGIVTLGSGIALLAPATAGGVPTGGISIAVDGALIAEGAATSAIGATATAAGVLSFAAGFRNIQDDFAAMSASGGGGSGNLKVIKDNKRANLIA